MIKAIIFDCFGVLTSDGWLPFKEKYFGDEPEKYHEATKLNSLANSNQIPYSQFLNMVSELAGVSVDELNYAMHKSVSNNVIFEYIERLKKNYKIGMLSNISGDWLNELFSEEQIALFDAKALSYETGFAKPDSKAYEVILKRLGSLPDECVYVDDQPSFVEKAKKLGMKYIHYEEFDSFKNELEQILKMSNSNK
jgi:FMN phosphatase YigB (HAD superfamily)